MKKAFLVKVKLIKVVSIATGHYLGLNLKLFIFDIMNNQKDKRVSLLKKKIGFQSYKDSDFKNNFIYYYKITFTELQINKLKVIGNLQVLKIHY